MSIGTWSFHPLVTSFPGTVFPNVQFWNVTNGTWEYQVQLAYPLNWTSTNVDSTVDTMYVLDGNALGMTATEAFRRRRPVESAQPDTIIVSIGYPDTIPDSPYSLRRGYDFQPPVCATCPPAPLPGVPSNADNFIEFIDEVLRPWVRNTVFANVDFSRDALYGHSFGGLFVLYALLMRPDLFDTFLSASPALYWNHGYILNQLGPLTNATTPPPLPTKPAFQISYGVLEQYPVKRRTETQAEFQARKSLYESLQMVTLSNQLYAAIKDSPKLRNVSLRPYPSSDHAAVGAAALADGIDYFLDW
ncbi:siderophore esteras-like protein IroE-like protein [Westerdykella ornata]|uniref:Siderophore esteras-like protein IroE-like protein n=1 Tax=Westerdykella ornata TaxID=318751 RepID=A0A6A6JXP5_WESOR|nr:siderophore esteras-like protein IroE-like protein [Westerdykella ornata]KAF2280964.1 siderophore esteras-like protein IroE-like protein [Westerdykella ornata]